MISAPSESEKYHVDVQEEPFSLDVLINRIEELQRSDQLLTIERLTRKNHLLQRVAVQCQKHSCSTSELLEHTQHAVIELQIAVDRFCHENEAAERVWLATWGIERPDRDLLKRNV